jgi:amino acid transporter
VPTTDRGNLAGIESVRTQLARRSIRRSYARTPVTTDSCPNRVLARLHVRHHAPVNSIVFGAITFAFSVVGLVGIGTQEAFHLLWNASRSATR